MRALQFRAFGDPTAKLVLVNLPDPQPRPGWAVVRIRAASVNPSDVKNVEGQMEGTVLPRVPGRDFSGVVEAGPPHWIGAEVWGTGGDAGFILKFSDGTVTSAQSTPLYVDQQGLERRLYRFAHASPFIYGSSAVLMAMLIGWLSSLLIRQQR